MCEITKGRKLLCKNIRTGIKYVDFAVFDEYGFTVSAQEIATLPSGLTNVYRYEVKGAINKFDSTPTVDAEKRTTEFKEMLNIALSKLTKESSVELLAMIYGRVVAFVHDMNGNVFVAGITNGLEVTTAPMSTDTSGYTVALEGTESAYPPQLSSSAKTALTALVSTLNVTD